MPVDAKRVQAVFLAAVEVADAAQRATLLDRECKADPELRRRVEALLTAHAAPASILARPVATPLEAAQFPSDHTLPLHPSNDQAGGSMENPLQDPDTMSDGASGDEGPSPLEILQPSTKPGSLGRLGHYEVFEVLGKGGFGTVVRAFDEKLHRMVAIKMMSSQLATTSPARKRFLREARSSAAIRHENIVDIHAIEEQPIPFLVMEYVAGENLQQRLDRTGPLDTTEVLRIGVQIARGLVAAHAKGMIHRDIKPANILLENGVDRVKITDFGLARAADDACLTQSGFIAGTPMYMAPEQAQGVALDHRADLFSFGSILYVICSGRPPFRASTTLAVLKRVAEDAPRPIREIIPEVPQWLCDVINKLHAKKPEDRFQSAKEIEDLLAKYLTDPQFHEEVRSVTQDMSPKVPAAPPVKLTAGTAPTCDIIPMPAASSPPSIRRPGRRLAIAAGALIIIMLLSLGFTEATGVTNLILPTVIRVFTPDGTLVVEVDDPGVKVTNEGPLDRLKRSDIPPKLRADLPPEVVAVLGGPPDRKKLYQYPVAFSLDGRWMVFGSGKSLIVWEIETNRKLTFTSDNGLEENGYAAFSKDSKSLVYGGMHKPLILSDLEPKQERQRFGGALPVIFDVAFVPDGNRILAGFRERHSGPSTLRLWDVKSGKEIRKFEGHTKYLRSFALSPDGRRAISGGDEETLFLWNLEDPKPMDTKPVRSQYGVPSVAWSPKKSRAACSKASNVQLWRVGDGGIQEAGWLEGHKTLVQSLAYSTDGGRLASLASEDEHGAHIIVWDMATEKPLWEYRSPNWAWRLAYAPDGRHLAVSNYDGTSHIIRLPPSLTTQKAEQQP